MKIVSAVCPNCGASIQVDMDKKNLTCNYCGNNLYLDDEVQHIQYDNAEETGYQFEKGRQRAQAESRQANYQQNTVSIQQHPVKKRNTWLWVLGWIFFFPLPLTILLVRKKKMNSILKYGIIAVAWLFYLIIGLSGESNDSGKTNNSNNGVSATDETTGSSDSSDDSGKQEITEESNSNSENEIDAFVSSINGSGSVNLEFVEDFVPSDKSSSHYKTEFRLDAYKDAIGKSYKYGDTTVDIILSSSGAIRRIYMDGATYEQCENMIRYASPLLDSTVTEADIQETVDYIAQNNGANGYYYAKLGLLMLGGGDKGYEFMLK